MRSYRKRRDEIEEFELKTMRLQSLLLINSQLPEKDQYDDPRKLIAFHFDEDLPEPEVLELTPEDWAELDKKLENVMKRAEGKP